MTVRTASAICWNTSMRSGRGRPGCGALVAATEAGEGEWGTECWACPLPRKLVLAWGKLGDERSLVLGGHNRRVGAGWGAAWRRVFIVHPGCGIAPFPQTHPGTAVTVLDLFDGRESLRPLWEQVQGFREAVAPIMAKALQGVHLICYSQGRHPPAFPASKPYLKLDPYLRDTA